MADIVLSTAVRATVLSLQRTSRTIDLTSLRLATGLKVNSALDNPQNFFASESLKFAASDYNRLLDGIGQSARTVEEALIGVDASLKLLDQAEAVVTESKEKLLLGEVDPAIFEVEVNTSPQSLSSQILQSTPDVYYRLNDTANPVDDSGFGGGVNATFNGGVTQQAPAIYTNGGTFSAEFDGVNDHIRVNDSNLINIGARPERTVELVFNADDVMSRQVLYEEGATVNSLAIYIENGRVFTTGTDQGAWGPNSGQGPTNISAPIVAGETYHVAFVFSSAENRFEGYLNGTSIGSVTVSNTPFPSHSGDIGIGAARGSLWFDTVSFSGNGENFDGRISDVAIYNNNLTDAQLLSHAQSLNSSTTIQYHHRDYENIVDQLGRVAFDASYRGINLLSGENLTTNFNPDRTSTIITEGFDLQSLAEALPRFDFNDINDVNDILDRLADAKAELREFGSSLTADLNVIQTREVYTRERISTLESGADDLIVADQNEEGANLLASQVRQNLGVTALNLAAISGAQTLRLF